MRCCDYMLMPFFHSQSVLSLYNKYSSIGNKLVVKRQKAESNSVMFYEPPLCSKLAHVQNLF